MGWPENKDDKEWDGIERRKHAQEDHDLLIEIHTYSKSMIESFKNHVATDLKQFEDTNSRISKIERWMYGCIGGLAALEVLLKFIH